jgi:hypothetical protein
MNTKDRLDKLNNDKLQKQLKSEQETKFYLLECVKFYNDKIDRYRGAKTVYKMLKGLAIDKIDGCNIQIDFLERQLDE